MNARYAWIALVAAGGLGLTACQSDNVTPAAATSASGGSTVSAGPADSSRAGSGSPTGAANPGSKPEGAPVSPP